MVQNRYQVVVIGGGVVGTAIARTLARFEVSAAVVEKNVEVGFVTTKANSGIVHAGFHSTPGTMKARLCAPGNRMMGQLCEELDVPFRQNGVMMVARTDEEIPILRKYLEYGRENGVPSLEIISRERVLELEPNLSGSIAAALLAPTGGVVTPFELAMALEENARANGVVFYLDTVVTGITPTGREKVIETSQGHLTADFIVNAAGLLSDEIARMVGDDSFHIKPRKGEEYLLDKRTQGLVTRTIFPTPTATSKGILVIPTVDGNIMIGPTAVETQDRTDTETTREGFEEVLHAVRSLVPKISPRDVITSFAGLRAASDRDDFIIEESPALPGLVNVAGIESPGLTAAPAIAEYVVGLLHDLGLPLKPKKSYDPIRRPIIRFSHLSREEQAELIAANPLYARVVCRCETVTEGEIVDAIKRGARTLDGIKFRVRAGAGRCQGGFCQPHVVRLLARELGIPETEVTKRGGESRVLLAKAKELLLQPNRQIPREVVDDVAATY